MNAIWPEIVVYVTGMTVVLHRHGGCRNRFAFSIEQATFNIEFLARRTSFLARRASFEFVCLISLVKQELDYRDLSDTMAVYLVQRVLSLDAAIFCTVLAST